MAPLCPFRNSVQFPSMDRGDPFCNKSGIGNHILGPSGHDCLNREGFKEEVTEPPPPFEDNCPRPPPRPGAQFHGDISCDLLNRGALKGMNHFRRNILRY